MVKEIQDLSKRMRTQSCAECERIAERSNRWEMPEGQHHVFEPGSGLSYCGTVFIEAERVRRSER
ncbi:MAG: hypothetical protein GY906_10055 [bacterium]|nr:hypothetical protein [bacterium]